MENFGNTEIQQSHYEQITFSLEVIDSINKDSVEPYKEECIKEELTCILERLPENIHVLSLGEVFVSRAKKEDKVITIWREKELNEYIESLKTRQTQFGSLVRW
jgi:hypothetical protein